MMQYYKEKINDLKNVIDMMTNINEKLCIKVESLQDEYQVKEEDFQRIDKLEDEKETILKEISNSFDSFSKFIHQFKDEVDKSKSKEDRTEYYLKERLDDLNTKVMKIHQKIELLYSDIKIETKENTIEPEESNFEKKCEDNSKTEEYSKSDSKDAESFISN